MATRDVSRLVRVCRGWTMFLGASHAVHEPIFNLAVTGPVPRKRPKDAVVGIDPDHLFIESHRLAVRRAYLLQRAVTLHSRIVHRAPSALKHRLATSINRA